MTSPASSDLQRFVRGTLGCKCPDEVFQSVALNCHEDHTRLMIGDRLLIYVMEVATDSAAGESVVADWPHDGLADRNSKRLNRFRLVVATPSRRRASRKRRRPLPRPRETTTERTCT